MWMVIISAAALVIVVVVAFGLLHVFRGFLYPTAPAMPPIVAETTEEILARLESSLKAHAPQLLEYLQPGLTAQEIADLEGRAGVRLPDDLKAFYRWRNGSRLELIKSSNRLSDVPIPGHRFVPLGEALGFRSVVSNQLAQATGIQKAAGKVFAGHRESWIPLFDDGAGDGYFFDTKRKGSQGAVFYCFAEDRTYVFFPSMKNLLAGVVKCYEKGAFTSKEGSLDENFELSQKIWTEFGANDTQ